MNHEKPYQPSEKEMNKAEDTMSEEQKAMEGERYLSTKKEFLGDLWDVQPFGEQIFKFLEKDSELPPTLKRLLEEVKISDLSCSRDIGDVRNMYDYYAKDTWNFGKHNFVHGYRPGGRTPDTFTLDGQSFQETRALEALCRVLQWLGDWENPENIKSLIETWNSSELN